MIRGGRTVGALALAGLVVWLTKQAPPLEDGVAPEPPAAPVVEPAPQETATPRRRSLRRRAAFALVYTTIFFAGGAVVAGAGNELAQVDAGSTDAAVVTDVASTDGTTAETTTTDVTTTETTDTTTTDAVEPTAAPVEDVAVAPETDPSDATPPAAVDAGTPAAPEPAAPPAQQRPARRVAIRHAAKPTPEPVSSPFPVLAFDPQAWLVAHPGTPAGNAAVAIAEQYLGVPYAWGGNSPATGFDCSGLTQFVYAQLGVWLPHYAAAQFLAYPRVDPTQLQPGDLVFFEPKADGPGHVAIYVGGDAIVEAPHTGAVVRIGSLSGAAAALGFLGAVRPSADASTVPTLEPFALVTVDSPPANWLVRAA
jgi:cell wall-associated NlpC family hydrolase